MRSPDALLRDSIIRTLAYFSLWQHPLTLDEVERYLGVRVRIDDVQDALYDLIEQGFISEESGYYSLIGKASVSARRAGQIRADETRIAVARHVRLISQFPFVRSICLTGSYAKHVLAPGADIDYLVVTEPGRLWITRTLLILYKKLVLKNSFQYFCLNYFVDTDHLQFNEHTVYTAVELASMLPAYGMKQYYRCWSANDWIHGILPNARALTAVAGVDQSDSFVKRAAERLFGLRIFDVLDTYLMRLTHRTWQRRFPHLPKAKREVLFETTRHVSRHHPVDYNDMVPRMVDQVFATVRQEHVIRV